MAEPARHLRAIDTDPKTGEVHECEFCTPLRTEAEGLLFEVRSLAAKNRELKRDKEAEYRREDTWPVAERLFGLWVAMEAVAAGKKRPGNYQWKPDRYELIRGFLKDGSRGPQDTLLPGPPRNDFERCAAAIIGRCLDCYSTKRSNGTTKRYNEWERIFKNSGERDESLERRPRNWRDLLDEHDPGPVEKGPRAVE